MNTDLLSQAANRLFDVLHDTDLREQFTHVDIDAYLRPVFPDPQRVVPGTVEPFAIKTMLQGYLLKKEAVEEKQGRLLALNVQMALDNKRLLEEQTKLKREMKRLEQESALWKLQEADMVRANTELIFEVIF